MRLEAALRLKVSDLKAKTFHDRTTLMVERAFVEGDLVYRRLHGIGKLLPKVEGHFTFRSYINTLNTSAIVFVDLM